MINLFDTKKSPAKAYRNIAIILVIILLVPFVPSMLDWGNGTVRTLDLALLYIMLALGLNTVVGFAGLLDLGYIAFYAIGAYMAGLLASNQFAVVLQSFVDNYPTIGNALVWFFGADVTANGIHLSVWAIVPLAAAMAGLFGAILGAPTLKLRGDYLAIVTLGFGEIIRIFMNNLSQPVNITNGAVGISGIDPVSIMGVSFDGEPGSHSIVKFLGLAIPKVNAYYYLFVFLCIVVVFITLRLQHSRLGRAFVALREDEIAAKAMGINTRNVKLLAFSLGASFGGIAGSMYASFQGFISPESFSLDESISVLAMVVIGGMGYVPGVILGGVLLASLPEVLRYTVDPIQNALFGKVFIPAEVARLLMIGLAMVLTMLIRPAGLWPSPKHEERPDADTDVANQSTDVVSV